MRCSLEQSTCSAGKDGQKSHSPENTPVGAQTPPLVCKQPPLYQQLLYSCFSSFGTREISHQQLAWAMLFWSEPTGNFHPVSDRCFHFVQSLRSGSQAKQHVLLGQSSGARVEMFADLHSRFLLRVFDVNLLQELVRHAFEGVFWPRLSTQQPSFTTAQVFRSLSCRNVPTSRSSYTCQQAERSNCETQLKSRTQTTVEPGTSRWCSS